MTWDTKCNRTGCLAQPWWLFPPSRVLYPTDSLPVQGQSFGALRENVGFVMLLLLSAFLTSVHPAALSAQAHIIGQGTRGHMHSRLWGWKISWPPP